MLSQQSIPRAVPCLQSPLSIKFILPRCHMRFMETLVKAESSQQVMLCLSQVFICDTAWHLLQRVGQEQGSLQCWSAAVPELVQTVQSYCAPTTATARGSQAKRNVHIMLPCWQPLQHWSERRLATLRKGCRLAILSQSRWWA